MNPFIESTVARPAPIVRKAWRRPYSSLNRAARVARSVARCGIAGILCSPAFAVALDINSASLEQLQSIKGIGPKTAQIILDERQRGGSYESLQDLSDRVKGIGPRKAASLQAQGLKAGDSKHMSPASAAKGAVMQERGSKTPSGRTSGRTATAGKPPGGR